MKLFEPLRMAPQASAPDPAQCCPGQTDRTGQCCQTDQTDQTDLAGQYTPSGSSCAAAPLSGGAPCACSPEACPPVGSTVPGCCAAEAGPDSPFAPVPPVAFSGREAGGIAASAFADASRGSVHDSALDSASGATCDTGCGSACGESANPAAEPC